MSDAILNIVRGVVGRRHKIARAEMRDILVRLAAAGLDLGNGWGVDDEHRRSGDFAGGWTQLCRDITIVSILADNDSPQARAASSNPGSIRYDMPGDMHPLLRATLMFAPQALGAATIGRLRRRAGRVLTVDG